MTGTDTEKSLKLNQQTLQELLKLPPKKRYEFLAAQQVGLCRIIEYAMDIITDLSARNLELEETLKQVELSNYLHGEMLKQILPSHQYEDLYRQCLGVEGPMQ